MITPVRDVDLCCGEFLAYKNLNARHVGETWSIAAVKGNDNRGLLVARADQLWLHGARAVVKPGALDRIRRTGSREVCAWFIGKIGDAAGAGSLVRVTFRPFERDAFFLPDTGDEPPVWSADAVFYDDTGKCWLPA